MRPTAQPSISLATRVDPDTDALRRDLQGRTGLTASRLIATALREYARALDAGLVCGTPNVCPSSDTEAGGAP
jgi:hypothetical protein